MAKETNDAKRRAKDKKNSSGTFTPRQVRYAVSTAIVLISLLLISAAFVVNVYFSTENSCYEDLAVETEDAIADLEDNLRSDRTMLRVIAGLIANSGDIDSIEVSGYLANYNVNSMITQMGVLLPGDELMSSGGHRVSVQGKLSFAEEAEKGEHISGQQPSGTNSNTQVIRSYVPIRKDGECIGLLFSASSPSNISKAWLPDLYGRKGYCYVVDRKTGEVIINTSSDQLKDIRDIPFTQTDAGYTKENAVDDILGGRKGYSVFSSGSTNENLYMCYLPFSIENWEMVVFVPESSVFSEVAPIRKWVYTMIAAACLIIVIYALWLAREIRASIADTEMRANIDVLTGLQNRNRYEAYLRELEGSDEKLTCLYIDANGLHDLNNSKGHFAGDQMLRFIADTLKIQFSDGHIYRIGGDEFVVFQSGKTEEEINECLVNFHEALQRNDYHAAVGTCVYGFGMSVEQLIKNAEKEMYEAKHKYYEKIGKVIRL